MTVFVIMIDGNHHCDHDYEGCDHHYDRDHDCGRDCDWDYIDCDFKKNLLTDHSPNGAFQGQINK